MDVFDLRDRLIRDYAAYVHLAQRLAGLDARIDRRLVNSVLHRDGPASVRYDAARYTFSLRQP